MQLTLRHKIYLDIPDSNCYTGCMKTYKYRKPCDSCKVVVVSDDENEAIRDLRVHMTYLCNGIQAVRTAFTVDPGKSATETLVYQRGKYEKPDSSSR